MTGVIYRCQGGHISFAKSLLRCGMKGCERPADIISETEIEWFYRISPEGLAINEKDLNMIIEDRNMPPEVKDAIRQIFPNLKKRRFWQK